MNWLASDRSLFAISVIAGTSVWVVFAVLKTEPWDSSYGWVVLLGLGLVLGFLGKGNPILWPVGIFLGQAVFGLGSFAKSVLFYSGGGTNLFLPLGLMLLVPFTVPALIGSFVGFGLRKALNRTLNRDAQKPRAR